MPKESLYPHVPGRKEPLFPHVPKGRQPAEKLPQTIEGGEPVPPQYRHLAGWVSKPLPREAE